MRGKSQDHQIKVNPPSAVRELIATVRAKLRRYSVLSGLLFCLVVAAIIFWLTTGIDAGWFALQRLELPVGIRTIILFAMVVAGIWLIATRVLMPLIRSHQDRDVALLLEKRFPQFQDRLLTTMEGTHGFPGEGPIVESMLQRTVDQTGQVASTVSSDDVFELGPLKWRGWIAGLLCLSVAGCGVVEPGVLQRWWKAFVLCDDTYHLRTTTLDFKVVSQPGDRRLEFRESQDALLHLHPRGADFELEMTVPDGQSEAGRPWVVPERVRVDVIRADGTRSRTYVSSASGRSFRFILTRLQETVTIEVLAGDFRTSLPLRIRAVTPPAIDSMHVECTYPDYTGWNQLRERVVAVLGSEVSLPMGTRFELYAQSNKPLRSARIVTDQFELSGDRSSCKLIPREGYEFEFRATGPLISANGKSISTAFHLTGSIANDTEIAADSEANVAESSVEDSDLQVESFRPPIPPNSSLKFFLHDEDDIISASPESVRLRGIQDRAPVIATRSTGVSNSITRRAIIPVIGSIQDDYGLESAQFQFVVDDETNWRPRDFRTPLTVGMTTFELADGDSSKPERFDVQPLELTEGQTLSLAIVATDGCSEPQPNTSRAEPIVFRIVSNEELLSMLYTRELNLRQRFEEVIQKIQQLHEDLKFHQDVAQRIEANESGDTETQDRISLTECARRSGDSLRSQNNELEAIAVSFEDVIQQLINNQIPPRELAENMRKEIVQPMRAVLQDRMVKADRSVSRFRVAANSGQDSSKLVAVAMTDVSKVIDELKRILQNVRDMAEFHEVLSDLNDILEEQQRILKETNVQQLKNLQF